MKPVKISKYRKWSVEKLMAVKTAIDNELYFRDCKECELPWCVEIVDDSIAYVVRRGESFRIPVNSAKICFAVTSQEWWSGRLYNEHYVDEDSMHAATLLCYWLSGVDNEELRNARNDPDGRSFAHILTNDSDTTFDILDDYNIKVWCKLCSYVNIGVEYKGKGSGNNILLDRMITHINEGVPPSDEELREFEGGQQYVNLLYEQKGKKKEARP